MYVQIFIEINDHIYIYISTRICSVFLKNIVIIIL
jgi:hypothetical protein